MLGIDAEIIAELIKMNLEDQEKDKTLRIDFKHLEQWGYESVTDYCRHLVETLPENRLDFKIEVYRGSMKCLVVNDIKKAAELQPGDSGWRKVKKDGSIKLAEPH